MKKNHILIKLTPIFIIWSLLIMSIPSIYADSTIEITPEEASPGSTLTFHVELPQENAINAYIWIQECNGNTGLCYKDQNITMTETSEDVYEATFNLQNDDATYFQYTIEVEKADGWQNYFEETKVNLAETTNTDSDGDDTGSDTPGFELGALFISVMFISLILYRRKR